MKYLICNLKMNHNLQEMLEYKKIIEENVTTPFLLAPAFCYLPAMHSKKYNLCSQNVDIKEEKKTGKISLNALKSLDVHSVLVGHSETNDTWEDILNKTQYIINNNTKAYVILSDTEEDFNYQYTTSKLLDKIKEILSKVKKENYSLLTFIYEPSWLVGTNNAMDLEYVNNTFYRIKKELKENFNNHFKIFYGGGLSMNNITPYLMSNYIDGLLLGSVSFSANNVIEILKNPTFRQN